jgi:transcriptional regulator with XRE-family HTH domain
MDISKISELIKKIRKKTGWSQEAFAREVGVSFSTVNQWENGKRKPSPLGLKQIEKIAVDMKIERGGKKK